LPGQFVCSLAIVLILSASALAYSGGTGTTSDPYQLRIVADWQQLMSTSGDWTSAFILTSDIDLSGISLTPVGNLGLAFTGRLDGSSHIIRNASINSSDDYIGLFGFIGSPAQIKNLGLESASFSGYGRVGALVGEIDGGTIVNCYSSGQASGAQNVGGLVGTDYQADMTDCRSSCEVSYGRAVGGLVGYNYYATLTRCSATGNITAFYERSGGLAGYNGGTLTDCYATGSVNSGWSTVGGLVGINFYGAITRCYSAGSVTGYDKVGGFIGDHTWAGTISGCYWDTTTSGMATAVGAGASTNIAGRTTAQMMTVANFVNWPFLGITAPGTWRMCTNGIDYPRLTWEFVKSGDFACPNGVAPDDLARLASDWLLTYSTPLSGADATGDSVVTFSDFALLASHWMQ
jgi:hypothetical protein